MPVRSLFKLRMSSGKRRVVVTGLGAVCSLGNDIRSVWKKILDGKCGITHVKSPAFENVPVKIAAPVSKDSGFVSEEWLSKLKEKRVDTPEVLYSFAASSRALEDAKHENIQAKESAGVCIGSSILAINEVLAETKVISEKGPRRISSFVIPKVLLNTPAAIVSMQYGFQGPNLAPSTACSAGAHAIGEAFRLIRNGDTDVMVTGGTDAALISFIVAAFSRIKALTTKFNNNPEEASRPFDKLRSGFVMADGAATLILEEYNHAKARNAPMYAEILGYGLSGDAYHLTSPPDDARGAIRSMRSALRDANLTPEDICYVNAHATSTPVGDAVENYAIKKVFNDHARNIKVSSTKGSTGHLLGAAGALEAVFTTLAVHEGVAPPTLNLHEVSSKSEFNLNYVPNKCEELVVDKGKQRIALSNSFGFGGTNACLCIGEVQ
ncbi:3-oxoacyl-[acyl-carrier-protein] synthase, mitochondrial-like [Dendronephthya gigantea]|uniref:3-oxoacyl-[acyl-carrier-protein] synthase, mitochondrial-like n=1 Tax=Dendronephthya gigantea TaxID=151771 RepID=UPI001069A077|nr:3-oxoacyl-[acyl-carrier-protein] synthase, mitochondrial-like [Dendronephthya gigantea]